MILLWQEVSIDLVMFCLTLAVFHAILSILITNYLVTMDIEQQLQALELKPQEIKIYLECLEKGESKLAQICKDLKIPRSTAKYSLEKLQKQGLLNIVQKNSSQLYVALPPKNIISTLKSQKEKIDEQIEVVKNTLPQLNQIYD